MPTTTNQSDDQAAELTMIELTTTDAAAAGAMSPAAAPGSLDEGCLPAGSAPPAEYESMADSPSCGAGACEQDENQQDEEGQDTKELSDVMDQLVENTDGDQLSLGDLLDALDSRSYGPLLLLVALISISPIGGVPGMSLITGALILVLCGQMLVGRSKPWLPQRLLSIEFERERLEKSVEAARPWAERLEKALHQRMAVLTKGPALIGVALICVVLAITFFPLALVPFGVFVPGAAIAMFALGITARDGLLVLLGYLGAVATLTLMVVYWPF